MSRLSEPVWADILAHLREHYRDLIRPGFAALDCRDVHQGVLEIHACDEQLWRYLERHCKPAFVAAAQAATGYLVGVEFVLSRGSDFAAADAPVDVGGNGHAERTPHRDADLTLNAHYVFDHF